MFGILVWDGCRAIPDSWHIVKLGSEETCARHSLFSRPAEHGWTGGKEEKRTPNPCK